MGEGQVGLKRREKEENLAFRRGFGVLTREIHMQIVGWMILTKSVLSLVSLMLDKTRLY